MNEQKKKIYVKIGRILMKQCMVVLIGYALVCAVSFVYIVCELIIKDAEWYIGYPMLLVFLSVVLGVAGFFIRGLAEIVADHQAKNKKENISSRENADQRTAQEGE